MNDPSAAQFLVSSAGRDAVSRVPSGSPVSLRTMTDLRRQYAPDLAAAITNQAELRHRAGPKFGQAATEFVFSATGLEQASRPAVSKWRAGRLAALGVRRVLDIGCGLGFDSLAFTQAGLAVTAIEIDPVTAVFAQANAPLANVLVGDATELVPSLLATDPELAVFIDPARRTSAGRTWNVADFSPSWDFVAALLATVPVVNVKLGPGLPYRLVPTEAQTVWISENQDVVEASVWTGVAPGRSALLLPGGQSIPAGDPPSVGPVGTYLYEPNGAAIRAGALGTVANELSAKAVAPQIAYLSGHELVRSDWATTFRVVDELPFRLAPVRAWVRSAGVGVLEIKKRGIDIDPAEWRRQLRPKGPNSATLVVTPTVSGTKVIVVDRV